LGRQVTGQGEIVAYTGISPLAVWFRFFQIIPKPENQHGDQDGGGKQGDGPEDPRIEISMFLTPFDISPQ